MRSGSGGGSRNVFFSATDFVGKNGRLYDAHVIVRQRREKWFHFPIAHRYAADNFFVSSIDNI